MLMTVLEREFDEILYRIKLRVGWREFSQLPMQITRNVVEMQDLRDVEDQVVEVVDQMVYTDLINNLLKNPVLQLK